MLITIPDLLPAAQVAHYRARLREAQWHDGRATAGPMAAQHKRNEQLQGDDPLARELGETILQALAHHPTFVSAALPLKVLPPMFNRYASAGEYGMHVDNAIRVAPGTRERVRTDVSSTLFFSDPDDYDGGELVIQDTYGEHRIKLPAGHLVVYPGTSLHRVTPVTRGERLAAFFWTQSLVADDGARSLLHQMDVAIQQVGAALPQHEAVTLLAGTYHNLLRRWSHT